MSTPIIIGIVVLVIIIIIVMIVMASSESAPASTTGGSVAPGISNGDVVKCDLDPRIYKIENGQKRLYSWAAYTQAGKPVWKVLTCAEIDAIPSGANI